MSPEDSPDFGSDVPVSMPIRRHGFGRDGFLAPPVPMNGFIFTQEDGIILSSTPLSEAYLEALRNIK